MPNAVALFPWVYVEERMTIGDIRLLPYMSRSAPGDQPYVSQGDLDGIMSAYADRPNRIVSKAAVLELGDWCSGMDDKDMAPKLFRAQNLIAFAALSLRRLFGGHFGYVNYDAFGLVVQRFHENSAGTFSFTTRRRDGSTSSLWSSDEFAFHRPLHVRDKAVVEVDRRLLEALQRLEEHDAHMYEALVEFNNANTDSGSIQEHVEVVMIKSAFEWLLEIGQNQKEFVKALDGLLPAFDSEAEGPLEEKWRTRWQHATRPVYAWAQEFCALRGSAAHGKQRGTEGFVLPYHSHLAFAAMFFPLIFKKVLAEKGLFEFADADTEKLRLIDVYVLYDPFDHDFMSSKEHPWSELDSIALMTARWRMHEKAGSSTLDSAE
jgi:hypothetical protein